jgi:regulator of sigma E protease
MMELINTILIMLATLAILVAVHEYGHFWVARRCGVKVLRFSIGFGRPLWSRRDRHGTEFVVAAIPLGGYVRMLDEREGEVAPNERQLAFNNKPVLARIAVVAAGPLANFALAVLAFWALFLAGESGHAPVIGKVESGSLAEVAGLEAGQEIVAVDGHATPTWQAVNFRLLDRIGDSGPLAFTVRYPGSELRYESQVQLQRWLAGAESPDLLGGLGLERYRPPMPPVVDEVVADSPAERAGFQPGDEVLSADGEPMPSWEAWVGWVRERPGQPVRVRYLREGLERETVLEPERVLTEQGEAIGRIGMAVVLPQMPPEMLRRFERGPLEALAASVTRTGELVGFTFASIGKMLQGLISPANLSGPITIAKVASSSAESGLESYIGFLALLSVSLGVLNLLPIPVLDGGHLLYYTVELVARRPVPERVQALGYQIGLFLVLGLMMLALYNDIARL